MIGHPLSDLELLAIAQIFSNSGRPERLIADLGSEAGGQRAPLDHPVSVGLRQTPLAQAP